MIPSILTTLIVYLKYPLIYYYVFSSHTALNPRWSFFNSLTSLLGDFNIQTFIILFVFLLGIVTTLWFKNNDGLFLLPLPFFYIKLTNLSALSHIESGEPVFTHFATYYFTTFFPFLFIAITGILRKAHTTNVYRFLQISFILFLIYFGTYNINNSTINLFDTKSPQKNEIINKINSLQDTLIYDDQSILIDKELREVIQSIQSRHNNRLIIVNNTPILDSAELEYVDPIHGRGFKTLNIYNRSAYNPAFIENQQKYQQIQNNTQKQLSLTPSMIILSLINVPNTFLLALKEPPFNKQYCAVFTPQLATNRNGIHGAIIFYNDKTYCNSAKRTVTSFIQSNFDLFCNYDELLANTYKQIMAKTINEQCNSGKKGIPDNRKSTSVEKAIVALLLMSTTLAILNQRSRIKR